MIDLGEIYVVATDAAFVPEDSLLLRRLLDTKLPLLLVSDGTPQLTLVENAHRGTSEPPWESSDPCAVESFPASRRSIEPPETPRVGGGVPLAPLPVEGAPSVPGDPSDASVRIRRAITFMRSHFQEPVSLNDVSREACLSPCHFCRVFKKQVGITYSKYLSWIRIEEATRLLLKTDLTVTEICYRVGFNDLTHFERVFKTRVRQTPTRFRHRVPIR